MTAPRDERIEMERMLFRYSMALERGDFDTVASILEAAANNPALNRMIQELDAAYTADPDLNPETTGEHTMAQLTRPLILPQKPKHNGQLRRSSLLFPFAAVVAVALVGFSLLSFNPPPNFQQQVPPVNPGRETETPTPVPFEPSLVPTLIPGADDSTSTPNPFGPTVPPTIVPLVENPMTFATVVPGGPATLSSDMPTVIVPIYCEGITRGAPQTHLFTRPFVNGREAVVVGIYETNILVPINDVATDSTTGEIWYYVGDANSVVNPGDQGWTHSANIELMWNCSEELDLLGGHSGQPTALPSTATPFPLIEVSPTAIPFTATPIPANLDATPSATPIGQ